MTTQTNASVQQGMKLEPRLPLSNCMKEYFFQPSNFARIQAEERGYLDEVTLIGESNPFRRPSAKEVFKPWESLAKKHWIPEEKRESLLNIIAGGGDGADRAIEDLANGSLSLIVEWYERPSFT